MSAPGTGPRKPWWRRATVAALLAAIALTAVGLWGLQRLDPWLRLRRVHLEMAPVSALVNARASAFRCESCHSGTLGRGGTPAAGASLALLASMTVPSATPGPADGDEFFEKTIRPILVDRCLKCHGDDPKPKGGLRLTSRDHLLKGGLTGAAAVAGKPDESLLVSAVRYLDELKMPPKAKLADAEIAALTKWVEMGLPWPGEKAGTTAAEASAMPQRIEEARQSWAFRTPRMPAIPQSKDDAWPTSDLDRFILATLEAAGLKPAPRADKRTLIRRATFDLIGLPPTPEEVDAYLRDDSPDAYAKVVDRLLASPHYGERWARRWLDVVRYADSLDSRGSGQPGDILDAWRYRDWVVSAMNRDLPYDQFVRDQIAGDLLPGPTPDEFNRDGTIATTMLAIGNWGNGDADKEKIVTDIADDQVDVVSKAFLGLTVACARCHDHKFDPISQADYYGLAGIFFSTRILGALTPKGAGETIIRVPLVSPAEMARREARDRRIAELEKAIAERRTAAYRALANDMRPQAGRYLLAAQDYRTSSEGSDLAEFATKRNLIPFALRQWVQALGGAEPKPLAVKSENIGGIGGVIGWTGPNGFSSLTANTTGAAQQIATFRLPPRSISVHPGPASAAVVSWTSPVAGKVRVTGRIADGDSACGNGVAWSIEHRTARESVDLASGELANAGSMAFGQAKGAEALASVAVAKGDRIDLVVAPKGEYSCDTTTIDVVISEWDGPATWDVTRDCLDTLHTGNPHSDRTGKLGIWLFGDLPNPRAPGGPMAAARTHWREALANQSDRAQIERLADEVGKTFPLDDESSPFWIKSAADDAVLPAETLSAIRAEADELAMLKADAPPPIEFANAAQDGGIPNSTHPGTHDVRIHIRGRYDRLGDLVPRRFPTALAGDTQSTITTGSGRLDLACWISRPDNPLTARVMVNRLWQGHFGEGLIRTPSNFGKLGDKPSHPELLDWLALKFVENGWSMKRMHRLIMLSSTYQQSSTPSADDLRIDADNRLLSRQNRRRLEAEVLRDNLVAVSGGLDRTLGGPADRNPDTLRRGLYVVTIRSDRSTVAALFDQADSTAPVDRRVESTVAPQSLYLLNHPFVNARAGALAKRLLALPGDDRDRIARAYEILFARPATADEIALGLESVKDGGDAREAAWQTYCQILLCANEFLYID